MTDLLQFVGNRIRDIRKSRNLSQQQLAEKADTHHSYIGDLERGNRNITLQSLEKIANALEVDVSELFAYQAELGKLGDQHQVLSEILHLLLQQSETHQQKVLRVLREVFGSEG